MLFFPLNKHLRLPWFTKFDNKRIKSKHSNCLIFTLKCSMNFAFNPRRHKGGGVNLTPSLEFFGFKFLFFDRLPKALAQLFFVTSLCCCGCHGNQLSSDWFQLIESTKNAHYMCQISSQSNE